MSSAMWNLLRTKWRTFGGVHPIARGMISYAVIWPTSSLVQQTFEGKNLKTYDWMRCLRFSVFGGLYVAPTLYGWVRLTTAMWPQTNLRIGLVKATIEQLSYGPFACASFFFGMSLLEGKTAEQSVLEVRDKFWPTYKVGVCVWPILQTVNFSVIPEANRVVFVSICSLMWTTYLAYMKTRNSDDDTKDNTLIDKPDASTAASNSASGNLKEMPSRERSVQIGRTLVQ